MVRYQQSQIREKSQLATIIKQAVFLHSFDSNGRPDPSHMVTFNQMVVYSQNALYWFSGGILIRCVDAILKIYLLQT